MWLVCVYVCIYVCELLLIISIFERRHIMPSTGNLSKRLKLKLKLSILIVYISPVERRC